MNYRVRVASGEVIVASGHQNLLPIIAKTKKLVAMSWGKDAVQYDARANEQV